MKLSINAKLHYKNGEEENAVIEIEAEDKNEAKFLLTHGIHLSELPPGSQAVFDFRTLKELRSKQ